MKNTLKQYTTILLLILISASASYSQTYSDSTLNRIQDYLTEFKIAIDSKDTNQIEKYIFPTDSERADIVGHTIEHILKNDENKFGNFSYSNRAYNLIKDSLYINFKPIPDHILKILRKEEDQRRVVDQFNQNDIAILDINSAHVILLLEENKIQLFFWENMNVLLGE